MPTYNYYCAKCNSHFSYFQKMSDLPLLTCEKCNGKIERKITGGTGLIFKGNGFYLTDYKNNKDTNKNKTENSVSNKTKLNQNKSKDINKKIKKKEK